MLELRPGCECCDKGLPPVQSARSGRPISSTRSARA